MLGTARVKRCIRARSVWKTVNYPIYIPEEDAEISALVAEGNVDSLVATLVRRTSLGSGSAAAVLGVLEFMGAVSGKQNLQATIGWCSAPAKAGDPYPQYVLAWAYWEIGKRADALRWMNRSVAASFLPALVDAGRMLVAMADNSVVLRTAVGFLWRAHRLGHVAPLAVISGIAFRGRLGPIKRLLGLMLFPYAAIRLMLVVRCDPFGVRSFSLHRRPDVPFFRRTVRGPGS